MISEARSSSSLFWSHVHAAFNLVALFNGPCEQSGVLDMDSGVKKMCSDLPVIKTTNDLSFTFSSSTTNRSERPHPSGDRPELCQIFLQTFVQKQRLQLCNSENPWGRIEIIVHKQQQDCHQCLTCVFAVQVWRWWALLCTTSLTTPGLANSSTWRTSMWWRPTEVWTPDLSTLVWPLIIYLSDDIYIYIYIYMQVNYLLLTLKTEQMTDNFRFCVCTLRSLQLL